MKLFSVLGRNSKQVFLKLRYNRCSWSNSHRLPVTWTRVILIAISFIILSTSCKVEPEPTEPKPPTPIVVIDPGHGGKDPGATRNGIQEKDVVLDIAKMIKDDLEKQTDCIVHMTREDDTYVKLSDRAKKANDLDAHIFVSIHANANYSSKPQGCTAIYANDDSRIDKSRDLAATIYQSLVSLDELTDSWFIRGHRWPYENTCWKDGNETTCTVLNETKMPAVIVETAFVSNELDAEYLTEYQRLIASQITMGIMNYFWTHDLSSFAPVVPSVESGQTGGLESWPNWWNWDDLDHFSSVAPWSSGLHPLSRQDALTYSISLTDLMPVDVLSGTTRILSYPEDVVGNSNALEAMAADYLITEDGTDIITAAVAAYRTLGSVYAHDYAVCSRFKDGHLAYVTPVKVTDTSDNPPVYFWGSRMRKHGFIQEYATTFAVHVSEDEETFTVYSHWMSDQLPIMETGYVLTFQIWAVNSDSTIALAADILENFASRGTLNFQNDQQPAEPQVFISEAAYEDDEVNLIIINNTSNPVTVDYTAVTWRAPYPESEARYDFTRLIAPGTSLVQLPMPTLLNGVIYADDGGGFIDKVYVADGHWFAFDDSSNGGTSTVTLVSQDCAEAANLTSNDRILAGCAEITGKVGMNGWVGMTRALNPPGRPVIDVSSYHALTFFAKGDGKSYRVSVETQSVKQLDSSDFHQFVFTTSSEWRQFVIPLRSFSQRGWDSAKLVPFTGKDVTNVAWSSVGDPLESINLAVDRVAFVNSTIISETTALPDTADVAGPYTVTTHVTDESSIDIVRLFCSLDSGTTFTSVTMMLVSDNTFSASIPGQPLGTEVWYYIEATDTHGNIATDPVDIPCTTYRFQVSERPYLLVDNFVDTNPVNVLGGNSGPYGADSGSSILVHYDEGHVQLDYDVSVTSSYAGYYTLLSEANLTPYSAVTFMIKGAAGGEKVRAGLRDNWLNETKIVIGEYLPGGITTSWQKVTIPLVAFTRVADWSNMENFNVDFENRIDGGAGIIYLDDIKFEYIAYIPVVVDNFNDMTGENGVGGWLWTWNGGGANINIDYDQTNRLGDSGAGYRISYSGVTESAWALAVMDLAGLDASTYRTLSFYVKGADGGEQPNIYLVSKTDEIEVRGFVDIEDYLTVTTSWQMVNIPLEAFDDQGVDLSNLAYFQLGFEWEEMAGTIYLDNITIGSHDYDADGDGDVDGLDLVTYINTHEDFSDLSSFATVFGATY